MDDLVRQGKVRYIGASNYPVWRLMEALWVADRDHLARYDSLQPHYNLVHRSEFERELAEVCRTYGLGVIPYSPLAGGFLTGKYKAGEPIPESARASSAQRKYFNPRGWDILAAVETIAAARNKSISQIALAWHLSNPVVTSPIIGPRTLVQLSDNLGAVGLRLNEDEISALDQASAWED
jgi:aryl-alcohol dehydrogenase-like predicted oxidoreductase